MKPINSDHQTLCNIMDAMGSEAKESEAVAMRQILIARGIADLDDVGDEEWLAMITEVAQ